MSFKAVAKRKKFVSSPFTMRGEGLSSPLAFPVLLHRCKAALYSLSASSKNRSHTIGILKFSVALSLENGSKDRR